MPAGAAVGLDEARLLGQRRIDQAGKLIVGGEGVILAAAHGPQPGPVGQQVVLPIAGHLRAADGQPLERIGHQQQAAPRQARVAVDGLVQEHIGVAGVAHPEGLLVGGAVGEGVFAAQPQGIGAHLPNLVQARVRAAKGALDVPRVGRQAQPDVVQHGLAGIAVHGHDQVAQAAPQGGGEGLPAAAGHVAQGVVHPARHLLAAVLHGLEAQQVEGRAGRRFHVDLQPADQQPAKVNQVVLGLPGGHGRRCAGARRAWASIAWSGTLAVMSM